MRRLPEPILGLVSTTEPPARDPFLGASGYFDGTDASLLAQMDPSKISAQERREIEDIYGKALPAAPPRKRTPKK